MGDIESGNIKDGGATQQEEPMRRLPVVGNAAKQLASSAISWVPTMVEELEQGLVLYQPEDQNQDSVHNQDLDLEADGSLGSARRDIRGWIARKEASELVDSELFAIANVDGIGR